MCFVNNDSFQKLPYQTEASNWSVVPHFCTLLWVFHHYNSSSTNQPGTSPTSIHSSVARTLCTAIKDFNQKPWILSGPTHSQSDIDFNFLLPSSLVIFSVFSFPDEIFSFTLSIHSTSCLCSTFVLCIPFQNPAALQHSVVLSSPLYLKDFWKIFLSLSRNSCCLEIVLSCCHIVLL